ncbi:MULTISPECIES: GLPGLI family protein [Culturomica]|jgi:GLPGLI family protein|uniref:GLPGLI family protein n=1 Tax=Culturomica TaxID=1926651 RepID=UPI00033D5357|nr:MULTISPECIES: GLPGLI family protein [Culturomica]CCZ10037.1 putative uncharacterized protein [Odoribacter sp. CAG:788]HBO26165.1 GLPGLI family protein [Culturomica sp.]
MKTILAAMFFFLVQFPLFAQVTISFPKGEAGFPRDMTPRDTLDYTYLNAHYCQLVRENKSDPDTLTKSEMMLQIGKQVSRYSNYTYWISDSIKADELKRPELSLASIFNQYFARTYKAGDKGVLLKNYPKGQCLFQKEILINEYVYTEDMPVFDWTFMPDTLRVLGYLCKKATCSFRGRDYTAWYAPDIPLSNGPWKFNGLPGLILKVEDADRDYSFECTALYRVDWESPIYLTNSKLKVRLTRKKFMQVEKMAMSNPGAVIGNSGLVSVPKDQLPREKYPYNPIELE